MSSSIGIHSVEVVTEETEGGVVVTLTTSLDKLTQNGYNYKTVVLDFHNIFVNTTCGVIDPSTIVTLNLSGGNLNCFPDSFTVLKQLKRLNLSHNKLNNVPDCILNGLKSLEFLDLSNNLLKSFEAPECIKNLRVLNVSNNLLTDFPDWIMYLKAFNLEEFCFNHNCITSLNKSRFLKTPSYELAKIELKNCQVRNEDIKFLKQIPTLVSLDLSNDCDKNRNCFANSNSFYTLFEKPAGEERLKILVLNDLQLAFLPEAICKLKLLEELYLSKNDLLFLPDSITKIEKLCTLDVSYNQLTSLPDDFINMQSLRVFKASNNNISKEFDYTVMKLRYLDLYNNYLDLDCDMKIDCNMLQVDLEQNYFDTFSLNQHDYLEKKQALRDGLTESRNDGPKEQQYDESDLDSSNISTDSDCYNDGDIVVRDEMSEEEDWSSEYQSAICDNGCTSSDNEWTGRESIRIVRKKQKYKMERFPSWVFEDVEIMDF